MAIVVELLGCTLTLWLNFQGAPSIITVLLYASPSIISRFLGPFLSSFIKMVTVGMRKGVGETVRFKFGCFVFPKLIQSRLKLINAT